MRGTTTTLCQANAEIVPGFLSRHSPPSQCSPEITPIGPFPSATALFQVWRAQHKALVRCNLLSQAVQFEREMVDERCDDWHTACSLQIGSRYALSSLASLRHRNVIKPASGTYFFHPPLPWAWSLAIENTHRRSIVRGKSSAHSFPEAFCSPRLTCVRRPSAATLLHGGDSGLVFRIEIPADQTQGHGIIEVSGQGSSREDAQEAACRRALDELRGTRGVYDHVLTRHAVLDLVREGGGEVGGRRGGVWEWARWVAMGPGGGC